MPEAPSLILPEICETSALSQQFPENSGGKFVHQLPAPSLRDAAQFATDSALNLRSTMKLSEKVLDLETAHFRSNRQTSPRPLVFNFFLTKADRNRRKKASFFRFNTRLMRVDVEKEWTAILVTVRGLGISPARAGCQGQGALGPLWPVLLTGHSCDRSDTISAQ